MSRDFYWFMVYSGKSWRSFSVDKDEVLLDLCDTKLEKFAMIFTVYMPSKRRIDCDNIVPKFILDGFSESGFIIDDDGLHLLSLTLRTGYDKENPRTEIEIINRDI